MRVSDLAEGLLRDYTVNGLKSLRTVKRRWEIHLAPSFGHLDATELSSEQIEAYIARRRQEGAQNATINRELAALRRAYSLAIIAGKFPSFPPYIPHLRETNVRKGFLRDQQYQALVNATAKQGLWLRGMMELGFTYGWRKSELMNLKVRQCDLEEQTITLDPGETKNDDARTVVMTATVFELLRECIAGKGPEDYVFSRTVDRRGHKPRKGGHISDMRQAWAEACKAAACPDLRFHDLRRTGARNMRRVGIAEGVIMKIGGWRTRSVFERYNIIDSADLDGAVKKLEEGRRHLPHMTWGPRPAKVPVPMSDAQLEPRKVMPAAEVARYLKQQAASLTARGGGSEASAQSGPVQGESFQMPVRLEVADLVKAAASGNLSSELQRKLGEWIDFLRHEAEKKPTTAREKKGA